jgi:hypothetical protein
VRFHPEVAPVKIAVLALLNKRNEIVARCRVAPTTGFEPVVES